MSLEEERLMRKLEEQSLMLFLKMTSQLVQEVQTKR